MGITHLFTSAKADGSDVTKVRPSAWNAEHVVDLSGVYALLAGVSGGQTLKGGTGSGENLTLNSTAHATKGKIYFGANSAYDEVNSRLGIGTAAPTASMHIYKESGTVETRIQATGTTQESLVSVIGRTSAGANVDGRVWAASAGVFVIGTFTNHRVQFYANSSKKGQISETGNFGIGDAIPAISDGVGLHINGKILRLDTPKTPASAGATGNQGEICWDASYIYVCTATNTWKRAAISTW